jgi:hypothetical protein
MGNAPPTGADKMQILHAAGFTNYIGDKYWEDAKVGNSFGMQYYVWNMEKGVYEKGEFVAYKLGGGGIISIK